MERIRWWWVDKARPRICRHDWQDELYYEHAVPGSPLLESWVECPKCHAVKDWKYHG